LDLAEACLPAGLLADTDAVVHAAAMTMVPPTAAAERVRAVNVAAAVAVARAAAKSGVRR
jgi:nucleoside-diphosphate-sugar epimerase